MAHAKLREGAIMWQQVVTVGNTSWSTQKIRNASLLNHLCQCYDYRGHPHFRTVLNEKLTNFRFVSKIHDDMLATKYRRSPRYKLIRHNRNTHFYNCQSRRSKHRKGLCRHRPRTEPRFARPNKTPAHKPICTLICTSIRQCTLVIHRPERCILKLHLLCGSTVCRTVDTTDQLSTLFEPVTKIYLWKLHSCVCFRACMLYFR